MSQNEYINQLVEENHSLKNQLKQLKTSGLQEKMANDKHFYTGNFGKREGKRQATSVASMGDIFDYLANSQGQIWPEEELLIAEKNRLKALGDNFPNGCLFRLQIDTTQLKSLGAEQTWHDYLTLTYASANWEKLTNVPISEAMLDISVPFTKIHSEDLDTVQSAIFNSLLRCNDFNKDIRYYYTATDMRWIQLSSRSRLENNRVVCDGFILDITERKLIETELASHREELERQINERTEKLGTANEELLAANEELFTINEEYVVINEELRRNNELLQHEVSIRKETMQKLEESENKLRNFIEQSFEGIMILDKEGRVIEWNRSLEQISGIPRNEAIGQYEWEILKNFLSSEDQKPEAFNRLYRSRVEYMEGGNHQEPVIEELTLHMSGGWKRHVRVSIFPIGLGTTCFFGRILRDVTEQKLIETELNQYHTQLEQMVEAKTCELSHAKEKAEESDRLKSAFLANISHEIRTPLNGILGFLNLFTSGNLSPETRQEYINMINNCSRQLVQLFDDIIDIAKAETNQLNIDSIPYNVNDLMTELQVLFHADMKTKNKEHIKLFLDDSEFVDPCIILVDPVRLRQILCNLITNAIKFTNRGHIRFGYRQLVSGMLEFTVEDTGIGIPKDKFITIFERFCQIYQGNNRTYGGAGLGLPISQNLVQLMGGEICVKSDQAEGSTFCFTIPYRPVVPDDKYFFDNLFEKTYPSQ